MFHSLDLNYYKKLKRTKYTAWAHTVLHTEGEFHLGTKSFVH